MLLLLCSLGPALAGPPEPAPTPALTPVAAPPPPSAWTVPPLALDESPAWGRPVRTAGGAMMAVALPAGALTAAALWPGCGESCREETLAGVGVGSALLVSGAVTAIVGELELRRSRP